MPEILEIWPIDSVGSAVARFHVQMPDGIRFYSMKLIKKPDGTFRSWAPSAFGGACFTLPPVTADAVTKAAVAAFLSGDFARNDRSHT